MPPGSSQQIRAGASFPAYARQFSEASTAALGGDLGWVRPSSFPTSWPRWCRRCRSARSASRSPMPGGFSIIALADKRQILVADPRDARAQPDADVDRACRPGPPRRRPRRAASSSARPPQAMGGCGGAAAAAAAIGAELVSNDQVRVRDLPPRAPADAARRSASARRRRRSARPSGVSVLVLCGRDDPQAASGPSFDQIYAQLERAAGQPPRAALSARPRRDAVIDYR